MIELYKYLNDLPPKLIKLRKNIFNGRNVYFFESLLLEQNNCIAYRASQTLQSFLIEIRDAISLKIFKHKINTWYCNSCLCYCCKFFIHHLGLI